MHILKDDLIQNITTSTFYHRSKLSVTTYFMFRKPLIVNAVSRMKGMVVIGYEKKAIGNANMLFTPLCRLE